MNRSVEIPVPPIAKRIPYEITNHGDTRVDPYYWMREEVVPHRPGCFLEEMLCFRNHLVVVERERAGNEYDPDDYETRRLYAPAPDGKEIPISLVYRKGQFRNDGSMPLKLTAYGAGSF